MNNDIIVVRGGGDIATGTIHKLYRCGFKVVILEIENPSSIRRAVCFSEAISPPPLTTTMSLFILVFPFLKDY